MGNSRLPAIGKVFITAVLLAVVARSSASNYTSDCTESVARIPPGMCPTWHYPYSGKCGCASEFEKAIKCHSHSNSTSLKFAYCMTFNKTSKLTFVGHCPYNRHSGRSLFYSLPENVEELNEQVCGPLNRTDLLCSQCQEGLGPAAFSPYRECLECMDEPYGWILYFFMATFPQTILCLFVIIFRINAASPSLNGFVLVSQIITNIINTVPSITDRNAFFGKIVATCYGFWNLDFFRYVIPSFCIKEGMSTLTVIALEYTVALYPIFFTVVVYYCITLHDNGCRVLVFCWRPFCWCFARFRRGTWKLKGSVINAFVTFLLLSYSKFCSISFSLLQSVHIRDICGGKDYRVYYDVSCEMLSKEHLPYVVLASIIIIIFVCLPALFILFYQNKLFQKCLNFCKFKCVLIHELANTCQGCFKNGTSPGTRDYRWFTGLYLLLRILLIAVYNHRRYQRWFIVIPSIMAMFMAILRPYRNDFYNKLDAVVWMTFAIGTSWQVYTVAYEDLPAFESKLFFVLPLVYMVCLGAWSLIAFTVKKCRSQMAKRKKPSTPVTDQERNNSQDEQFSDRLLRPSEYTPLISASKSLTLSSDTLETVQSNDTY